jgi:DNA-binding CsgD family transcriptional regulator
MKAMANKARLEAMKPEKIVYSKTAAATYRAEVDALEEKLRVAEQNAPRERAAQRKANVTIQEKQSLDPNMKPSDIKKIGQQALTRSRGEVGAVKRRDRNIDISDREWEAIQAGAISETQLKKILKNTDTAKLRERATPRSKTTISPAKASKIKAMSASYTIAEIADVLGISKSTVSEILKS